MKSCQRCKINKELTKFASDKNTKDGYRGWCRDCTNFRRTQLKQEKGLKTCANRNNDKKGYRTCSSCRVQQPLSYYFKSNITKNGLTSACKDCAKIKSKIHYNIPLNRAKSLLCRYKDVDSKKGFNNDLTIEFLLKNIFNKSCFYCGDTLEKTGCDRIDNNKGHNISNVVPCCYTCNSVKSNKFSKEEMLKLGKIIKQIKIKNKKYA